MAVVCYLVKLFSPVKFGNRKFNNWLSLICLPHMLISELIDSGPDCYWDVGSLVCSLTQIIHLYQPCFLSSQELRCYSTSAVHLWMLQFSTSTTLPYGVELPILLLVGPLHCPAPLCINVIPSKLGPVAEIHPVTAKWYIKYPSICIQLLFSERFAIYTMFACVYILIYWTVMQLKCCIRFTHDPFLKHHTYIWAPLLETCWFGDSCWSGYELLEFGFVVCFASSLTYDPLLWH